MKTLITFLVFFSLSFGEGWSGVFTVTNTNDSGSGSLREALTDANYYPGSNHQIVFNIPQSDPNYNATSGVWLISPATPLPYITKNNILIDGTTQTTNQGNTNPYGPEIMLYGNNNTIDNGFGIINASGITIKGFIISDFIIGIEIYGPSSVNDTISGNYIGTNEIASDTLGNNIGIAVLSGPKHIIIGGTTTADRNIVSGNNHIGIRIGDADSNIVIGNYVGVDRTGTYAVGNYDGVSIEGASKYNIVGGTTVGERNIISGNVAYGSLIVGVGAMYNKIIGNLIGTDYTGTQAIPNTYGFLFDGGSSNNFVGGSTAGERNIISGNSGYGVFVYNFGTTNNLVIGNYIGTDITGTASVPNAHGIVIDGYAYKNTIESNVVSGNLQHGIAIHITGCDSNLIIKNYMGTDASGVNPLGNGIDGINISEGPRYNIIGGSSENSNIIAYNGGNGITITTDNDDYNKISFNSIFANNELGIDLFPPGINQNDSGDTDTGPNEGMNFPVINSADYSWQINQTIVSGSIDAQNPQNVIIEIFKSDNDVSGYGEGMQYLSSVMPDVNGFWTDTVEGLNPFDVITTTATDAYGNTSEFSLNYTIPMNVFENNDKNSNLIVYPNPFIDKTIISYSLKDDSYIELNLYDIYGRLQKKLVHQYNTKGDYSLKFETNELAIGTYVLKMYMDNKIVEDKKIIKN